MIGCRIIRFLTMVSFFQAATVFASTSPPALTEFAARLAKPNKDSELIAFADSMGRPYVAFYSNRFAEIVQSDGKLAAEYRDLSVITIGKLVARFGKVHEGDQVSAIGEGGAKMFGVAVKVFSNGIILVSFEKIDGAPLRCTMLSAEHENRLTLEGTSHA